MIDMKKIKPNDVIKIRNGRCFQICEIEEKIAYGKYLLKLRDDFYASSKDTEDNHIFKETFYSNGKYFDSDRESEEDIVEVLKCKFFKKHYLPCLLEPQYYITYKIWTNVSQKYSKGTKGRIVDFQYVGDLKCNYKICIREEGTDNLFMCWLYLGDNAQINSTRVFNVYNKCDKLIWNLICGLTDKNIDIPSQKCISKIEANDGFGKF